MVRPRFLDAPSETAEPAPAPGPGGGWWARRAEAALWPRSRGQRLVRAWLLAHAGGRGPPPPPKGEGAFWSAATKMAVGHGLAPLLAGEKWIEAPPADFTAALRRARRFTLAANIAQLDAARTSRALLRESGIEAVLLKGAALLEAGLYLPGERPMSDIDLLVRRPCVERARRVLVEGGWQEEPDACEEKWRWALRHHHNWPLVRPGRPGLALDLHWTPATGERVLPGFEELRLLDGGDKGAPLLPPAAQLYFCSVNAARHGVTGKLLFLVDVARLMESRADAIDWDHLSELAKGSRTERSVRVVLHLASRWLGGAPPPRAGPSNATDTLVLKALERGLLPGGGRWRPRALRLLLCDNWPDRARLTAKSLTRAWQRP